VPVNLSIKNVPEDVAEILRRRAARNRRSLQGELLALIEDAARREEINGIDRVVEEVKRLGITPRSESVAIIRADRDSR
jgi:plasmid stability protein